MPACRDCTELVGERCLAEARSIDVLGDRKRPAPLAACPIPIVEGYAARLERGHAVLEVGCGSWSRLRDRCVEVGARYEGIDGAPSAASLATRFENLADLSFADETFDFVVGTQSMEHWAEYGCSLEWGIYQCFRACKPGGSVLMNVPIHFHGTSEFMLGRLDRLRELFARFSTQVTFEEWGRDSGPVPEYYPYPGYLPLRRRPAYILDVHAVRDRGLPPAPRNTARTGLLGKLQAKPASYVLYSMGCRVLGVSR